MPRTSKCVLEDVLEAKDVLEDSISGNSNLKDSLSIIRFNVRSLQKNFDAFLEFFCNLPCSPDIIFVTERLD